MLLRLTLYIIAIVQVVLGIVFLVPDLFANVAGLESAPAWTGWLLAMFGARALGFGFGMALAARDPVRHRSWIVAMVGIQTIDWLATLAYLTVGAVTLAQVTTAAFLPVVFVLVLGRYLGVTREPA